MFLCSKVCSKGIDDVEKDKRCERRKFGQLQKHFRIEADQTRPVCKINLVGGTSSSFMQNYIATKFKAPQSYALVELRLIEVIETFCLPRMAFLLPTTGSQEIGGLSKPAGAGKRLAATKNGSLDSGAFLHYA